MKSYTCSHCKNLLYFENNVCLHCNHMVGFDVNKFAMVTLQTENSNEYYNKENKEEIYSYCHNAVYGACNWLVPVSETAAFCLACELNRTIPFLGRPENLNRWKRIEKAKHRLVYSLLRLGLPIESKWAHEGKGLAFNFMEDGSFEEKVMTGHEDGIITINIEEADEAKRVRNKLDMGERYRTLLGHFRHEVGHYYWDILMMDKPAIEQFRHLFGDEQRDYSEALEAYYKAGPPDDWAEHFISPYAGSHPWEDWAETWAHYLHLMDTLETAYAFGIGVHPHKAKEEAELETSINKDPYSIKNFDVIIKMWLPLMFAVNSLNRSMGHQDFYPFVISPAVIEKLRFIHEVCARKGK